MFNTNNARWCEALQRLEQNNFLDAEAILRELRERYIDEPMIAHQYLRVIFLLGEGSIDFLEKEAQKHSRYLPLQRDVVALLLQLGEKQKALQKALQNFTIFGESSELYADCGVIFRHLGDRKQAEIYFQRSLSLNQQSEFTWFNWANMYMEEGRFAEAEQMYIRALRSDDQNIEIWVQLIYAVLAQQDYGIALRIIHKAKRRVGELSILFYLQSLAHTQMKNTKEALVAIHQALQNGNQKIFWEQLISLFEMEGKDISEVERFIKNQE